MEVTLVVIAVCLVIGLCGTIDLLHPIIAGKDVEYKAMYYVAFFCISTLLAPWILLVIISPAKGEIFRDVCERELFKD